MAFSLTMLRSEVMASFAYRESHRRYYRDPELIPSTAQGYKVVQKPNRALNATWNTGIQANAMQRAIFLSDGAVYSSLFSAFFPVAEERRGSTCSRAPRIVRKLARALSLAESHQCCIYQNQLP